MHVHATVKGSSVKGSSVATLLNVLKYTKRILKSPSQGLHLKVVPIFIVWLKRKQLRIRIFLIWRPA